MGYLEIPEIGVNLPIYHGTSDLVLEMGVGHLESSSLPIGGESTHAVLMGHRGLPSSTLFNKLPKLKEGAQFYIHMLDETLASAAVDVSGRPYLVFNAVFPEERVGGFDTCMCGEFFRAFAMNAGVTLHLNVPYGGNSHHQIEALFKAAAHALRQAVTQTGKGTLSTKGTLE